MANQRPIELHDFVNQSRAAETLGITRMTIWQWIKDGKIQAVIVGGLRMIPQSEVERLKREINNQTARADTNPVNLSEASRRLGISYATLWRWIKQGKVTPVRILGLPYLTLDDVESLKNEIDNQATDRSVA